MGTMTFMDKQKNQLIKKFHALLGKARIGQDGKEAILSGFGVESTRDLTAGQLQEACQAVEYEINPALKKLDKARKQLIKSIFKYMGAMGKQTDMAQVKRIACRASGCGQFNNIGADRLKSLYNAFNKRTKDLQTVGYTTLINNINLN
jgi:hypothetical protein